MSPGNFLKLARKPWVWRSGILNTREGSARKPQADKINLVRALTALQPVPGPPETEPPFLRSTFESCEREMLRPSRRAISPARRDNVQFRRSSTGADRSAATTLRAACALSGTGPGAMRALRASTPTRAKSLRQSRTRILAHPEGLRTPKACAIRALVQPSSVTSSARARSALHDPRNDPKPAAPSSARRSPSQEIFQPCRASTKPSEN